MRMNLFFCWLFGLFVTFAGLSAPVCTMPVDRLVEDFPDADTVLLDEIERVAYEPDGRYETVDESWLKILTEKGRREESTTSFSYSKRYGEGEFVFVGIIGTNGVERPVDLAANVRESTDNSSMASNIYDPLDRNVVCRIPGLKVGETVHVKTRRKVVNPRTEGKWADLSVMEWTHPMLKASFEVKSPAALPIRRKAIRNPLGNIVESERRLSDGSTLHVFTATNSPQAFPEPDMPPLYTQVQNVRLSTSESWPEISKWYWNLCEPRLAQTNAAMAAKVRELGPDVRAIFKFVSQEIRYMGLTMEDKSPGYAPHDVSITFDNRYGVCRDKAALLAALLRMAGFDAFPVLINVGAKLDPDVPQPFFNHAIVAVDRGNRDYELMDPTNENAKDLFPAYLCNSSYLVARPEGETLRTSPVESPEHNLLDIVSTGSLDKDGAVALTCDIGFKGINDTAYRHALVRRKPEERVKFFENAVRRVSSGAELIRCEIRPKDLRDTQTPLSVKLVVSLPEMLIAGETESSLDVPFLSKELGVVNFILRGNTSLEKRKYALAIDTTACIREKLRLDLGGAAGEVRALPSDEKGGGDGFAYHRACSATNGLFTAERSLTVSAVEFSPEKYLKLREDIKRVEAMERKRPVFARNPLAEADVRVWSDESETTVLSDRAWLTTNRVVKEILTYPGMKRSSELKFEYNPTVGGVKLLSAVVSNRNGRVASVSPHEKNVMDCGWAASAPRYPAGRLLVVNLPSVEIGSVISYEVVRTVTNAPAPFYGAFLFDSREPVMRRVVRVNDWRREAGPLVRLPNEPDQPADSFWRDLVIVSSNRFGRVALQPRPLPPPDATAPQTLAAIRDALSKRVKVVGPSLYDLPLERQLTDPETVLRECYATRLDYVRTLCALLRGAGYEADVVLAAQDASQPPAFRRRIMFEKPNVRAFSSALCRVCLREGGFLGFGGTEKTVFLGTEKHYAPIGPSAFSGCDYYDPETGEFGIVTVPAEEFEDRSVERAEYMVRENGAVDLRVRSETYGSGVADFRRRYQEMLPEERSRHYQALLGRISKAATATGELETDVEGYPAAVSFSCYIPDFATVSGDSLTIQLPAFSSALPACVGRLRRTPFAVSAEDPEAEEVTVRFPEGYVEVEHLPESFALFNPANPAEEWLRVEVASEVRDGALEVRIARMIGRRILSCHRPEFHELVKDWHRKASSRANRTITVRRNVKWCAK